MRFVCVSVFNLRSPFHFLATSCVGSSEQLNVSPRVGDQSERPISPTTTTVDAAGHWESSGLTSCHTDTASQGQNPSPPWATVSHCVSFHPHAPTGATGERRTKRGGERASEQSVRRKGWRPHNKKAPRGRGIYFVTSEQWSLPPKAWLLMAGCCY